MGVEVELPVLELLCSRLCHELVSPVGAINNGVELLGEDDPDFVKDAVALVGQSARKAGQRLQFYRFAYGFLGSGGLAARASARDLATGLLEGGKLRCDWADEVSAHEAQWQKLALNLLVVATEALPRGGTVTVKPLESGPLGLSLAAEGESINFSPEVQAALAGETAVAELGSRTIHAYFTGQLMRQIGAELLAPVVEAGRLVLAAAAQK